MVKFDSNGHQKKAGQFPGRRKLLAGVMFAGMLLLVARAVDLQVLNKQFLQNQGDLRHVDAVTVPAYRGRILDRDGEPLAISTPVLSIWIDPQRFVCDDERQLQQLASVLQMPEKKLHRRVDAAAGRRFLYLKRQVSPALAASVKAMQFPGLYFQREFKRFYPAGEVTGHLLGFTNIDDVGQEGLELAYEENLKGISGSKRVIRDGKRRIIADVEDIKQPVAGRDLRLSIDQRLQYLAYWELKAAFIEHRAHAAEAIVLDAKTGEILAAVNQPSFNPNTRKNLRGNRYRNRVVTDVFEPGSTIKPFVVACALDNAAISPDVTIETHGWMRVGRNVVKDVHNYGTLDLTHVLKKSSNVAASKIALRMTPKTFWGCYDRLGFGQSAAVGFPGEASGNLLDYRQWHRFEQATLSFGYGLSTSLLQLARAYTALADDGMLHSASLLQREADPDARQVLSRDTAIRVRTMLEQVLTRGGTAYRARVDGYRVAGKTGTVKKASAGGYSRDKYLAVFVGLAPASAPRLVVAVMVDEPGNGDYYGGLVAGPVFARIMAGALRVLKIAPDQEQTMPMLLVKRDE